MSEITHLIFIKTQMLQNFLQAGNDKSLVSYFQDFKKKKKKREKAGDELTIESKTMWPYCILKPVPSNKNAKSHYLYNLILCSKFLAIPSNLHYYIVLHWTGHEIIWADLIGVGDAGKS